MPGIHLEGDWNGKLQAPADFGVAYPHSGRSASLLVDFQGSTEMSALHKSGFTLFDIRTVEGEEEESTSYFLTQERFWNNKTRKLAMEEGLHHFVPRVLYLLRPETALTSCLHFLAKELGGFTDFEHQRDFIFNNPGLMKMTKTFWSKVLENYWSAGFSPGITNKERYQLFLALVESFQLTKPRDGASSRNIPCPHIHLDRLHDAGIYLPSEEKREFKPTKDGFAVISKSQDRNNFPGVPTDLGYYTHCYTCGTSFSNEEEWSIHRCSPRKRVECNGCGLAFTNNSGYQIHALTFCKQGPLSASRCPVCLSAGPKCFCQTHWQRTYAKAVSIMDGTYHAGSWLAEEGTAAPILLDASVHLNMNFIPEEKGSEGKEPRNDKPRLLKESLWTLNESFIPVSMEQDGIRYPMNESREGVSWTSITEQLESRLGTTVQYNLDKTALPATSPTSAPEETTLKTPGAVLELSLIHI